MNRFFQIVVGIPRNVRYSIAVLLTSGLAFVLLFIFLGGARDDAVVLTSRLDSDIRQTTTRTIQAKADHDYVVQHQAAYETLLKSDRLVPHTRRTAVVELQRLARTHGLTQLNYSFTAAAPNSLAAATNQSATEAYRLSVEVIKIEVGAPLDGAIYRFASDISLRFPGSAVIERIRLERAEHISDDALRSVSRGEDARLVSGEISMAWRTAQAQERKGSAP